VPRHPVFSAVVVRLICLAVPVLYHGVYDNGVFERQINQCEVRSVRLPFPIHLFFSSVAPMRIRWRILVKRALLAAGVLGLMYIFAMQCM
jgi:hypothetical protein